MEYEDFFRAASEGRLPTVLFPKEVLKAVKAYRILRSEQKRANARLTVLFLLFLASLTSITASATKLISSWEVFASAIVAFCASFIALFIVIIRFYRHHPSVSAKRPTEEYLATVRFAREFDEIIWALGLTKVKGSNQLHADQLRTLAAIILRKQARIIQDIQRKHPGDASAAAKAGKKFRQIYAIFIKWGLGPGPYSQYSQPKGS